MTSLTNNSAFTLSNVVLAAQLSRVEKCGRRRSRCRASSGKTYIWENIMSIPGSRFDKANATLTCSEN